MPQRRGVGNAAKFAAIIAAINATGRRHSSADFLPSPPPNRVTHASSPPLCCVPYDSERSDLQSSDIRFKRVPGAGDITAEQQNDGNKQKPSTSECHCTLIVQPKVMFNLKDSMDHTQRTGRAMSSAAGSMSVKLA
ncbi:hypothetical protein GGX14DRAFT_397194 [Mycena pura]|uniref:Uncharacterized protein n=1 Tax=Mycena pura TaxID=153505 RepID=A0AAD6V8Y1_9AGAR|nr:hypothetical protein GGX14DRAFT_397194 [Mycena pura]